MWIAAQVSVWTWREQWMENHCFLSIIETIQSWTAFSRGVHRRSRTPPLPSNHEAKALCGWHPQSHSPWAAVGCSQHRGECPSPTSGLVTDLHPLGLPQAQSGGGLAEALWSPSTPVIPWICLSQHAGCPGQHTFLWGTQSQPHIWIWWCINHWIVAIKVVTPEKGKPLKQRWPFNCFKGYPVKQKSWSLYEMGLPPFCSKNHRAKISQPLQIRGVC